MILPYVAPRKDGKNHAWLKVTQDKRNKLGGPAVDREFRPWTSRENVVVRGCSVQADPINFLHELLDVRWMYDCQRRGVEYNADPEVGLTADIRQDARYQLSNGSTTMQSNSCIYMYHEDRCACPEEMMFFQGWGHDVTMAGVARKVIEEICPRLQDFSGKRRKGKLAAPAAKLVDLAGDGVVLPDFAMFFLPLIYVLRVGQFKKPQPTTLELRTILGSQSSAASSSLSCKHLVEVDASMSQQSLSQLLAEHEDGYGSGNVNSDAVVALDVE